MELVFGIVLLVVSFILILLLHVSIKETADRMTSGNFMHNKAAIKFSVNTIAKVLELIGLKSQNLKGNNYDNN